MSYLSYTLEEIYHSIEGPEKELILKTEFNSTSPFDCKDFAEKAYIKKLPELGKPSFIPNLIMEHLLLNVNVTTELGTKKYSLNDVLPVIEQETGKELEGKILRQLTGEAITIPTWKLRLKQMKEKYNYKEENITT